MNQERCECHDCTQARWKMSIQGQVSQTITTSSAYAITWPPPLLPPIQEKKEN